MKFYRPRTPLFLRPEPWLLLAALAYFTYEKASSDGLLAYEQAFPHGLWRGLNARAENFLNEKGVAGQLWASPINDLRKMGGSCAAATGLTAYFAAPLTAEVPFMCQQEKAEKFTFTLAKEGAASLERGYGLPVAAELTAGAASLEVKPGAELELLLPNGFLTLRTEKGFKARLQRTDASLDLLVQEGLAEAEPHFAENFHGPALAVNLSSEEKGKLKLPGRAPAGATKQFRAVPSGVYVQDK